MENPNQILILTCVLFATFPIFLIFFKRAISSKSQKLNFPPGPRPYPIVGNILQLGSIPLLSITDLSRLYGPIMSLKLGTKTTIVISSPKIAKEAFHKHDLDFSSRAFPDSARALDHHKFSVAWLPISPQWRALRRACVIQLFSTVRLDSTQFLRQRKVEDLINHVHEYSIKGEAIDLAEAAFTTVLNTISNMLFSRDFACYGSDKTQEFKKLVIGVADETGKANVSDLFPVLSFLDPQGVRARLRGYYKKLFELFNDILEERLSFRGSNMKSKDENDVLDSFLDIIQDESSQLSHTDVLHLFVDLFVAGIDTTSSTLEWAMAELIRNPNKMAKSRTELQQVLGKSSVKLEESMVSNLPFIQAVIKETLRLHPPAPLLVPHKANCDVELCGFLVPKNAQIIANVWAMGRDPSIWDDHNSFLPERFLESEIDFKGTDFEFIPFGAGRRICPGLPLASRALGLTLASLIYHFDWILPSGLDPKGMDMSQNYGITLHKAQPLRAIPIKV